MSRKWKQKKRDQLEKVGKIGKGKKTPSSADLKREFELKEKKWTVGGSDGAFAARVVEVHKRYAFVSPEPQPGDIDTADVWIATMARKYLVADRIERNFVTVGDRVLCVPSSGDDAGVTSDLPHCVIRHLAPRSAEISRADPQAPERQHVIASNMDQLVVVSSFKKPKIKWGLIDRYLVLAETEGVKATIVLNKRDLRHDPDDPEFDRECGEMIDLYRGLGYTVLETQANAPTAREDEVTAELQRLFAGRLSLLSGHSGVGKSSLVNLFDPELVQPVEPDEEIFYKGRHTTTFASFIKLGTGGYVIDTPGVRSFTFAEKGPIELTHAFVDLRPFMGACKYRECRHVDEPECAVKAAVERGEVSRWRYKSYLGILLGASGREGRLRDLPL